MADGLAVMQQRRTATPDAAPTPGSLAPGMLSVEMSSVPPRVWCGVPSSVNSTQQILLLPGQIDTGTTPPTTAGPGTLWFDESDDTLYVFDGTNWVPVSGGTSSTVSDTMPTNPAEGDLWWNLEDAKLYLWDGAQWVVTVNTPQGGTAAVGPSPPANPGEGDLWFNTGDDSLNVWDGSAWVTVSGAGGAVVASSPPSPAENGDLWWDDVGGQLYIYYDDGTSAQWVAASTTPATGAGVITISETEPTSPEVGALWWATDVAKLFFWDGTQWIITINTPDGGGGSAGPIEGPIIGVTDGSDAAPGMVGEFQVLAGLSGVTLVPSNFNIQDVLFPPLGPGDWDVTVTLSFNQPGWPASAYALWVVIAAGSFSRGYCLSGPTNGISNIASLPVATVRISSSAPDAGLQVSVGSWATTGPTMFGGVIAECRRMR